MARDRLQEYLVRALARGYSWSPRLGRRTFALLPRSVLVSLAVSLARPRALGWYPRWKFGDGPVDDHHRLRLDLWEFFRDERLDAPFEISWYDGLRVTQYLGNDASLCLYVGGTYDPNEFAFLAQVLHPGMTFVDVGANDGLYALFASRRVGLTGRVVALEPSSREFARLERNLRLNDSTNVSALRAAAADRAGVAPLRLAGFGHEGQNTLGSFAYAIEQEGSEEARLVTLDEVVADQHLARVDVVKLDVEGGELNALKGAQTLLAQHKPLILLEIVEVALSHQGASRQAVLGLLESFGYRFLVFGAEGRPEPAGSLDVDGVNIVATHRDRAAQLHRAGL